LPVFRTKAAFGRLFYGRKTVIAAASKVNAAAIVANFEMQS
jgi:hypothetical protein